MEKQAVRIGDLVRVTQGHSSGDLSAVVTDVSHDSRQAKSGSLFVAVRGELFDAHKFIPQVMEQGAVGILSELEPTMEWRSFTESQSGRGQGFARPRSRSNPTQPMRKEPVE